MTDFNKEQIQINQEKTKSPTLIHDMDTLWQLLKNKPQSVYFISPTLADNKEFIRSIVTNFGGWFLQYASENLKVDKELIKLSFEKDGRLNYLPLSLQNDIELVSLYLERTQNLHLCSHAIRDSKELVLLSFRSTFNIYSQDKWLYSEKMNKIVKSMSKDLFYDEDIKNFLLTNWLKGFNYAPEELKHNDEWMLKAIDINPFVLQFASRNFKDNREYVNFALQKTKSMKLQDSISLVSYSSTRIRKILGKISPLEQMNKWLLKDNLEENLSKNKTVIKPSKM